MSDENQVVVLTDALVDLGAKATSEEVINKINEIIAKVNSIKIRDRGPESTKSMTEELARKVMLEEPFCRMSHRKAADTLGLSYGQVSSVRGRYTFKKIGKEWQEKGSKETWSRDYFEAQQPNVTDES